jgi:hypothetical protein
MHGLVRSVRCRALDFITPRHTSHIAACHNRDTTRRDSMHPTVKLHLAVLPRRRARLCSHLHRVHYNERDAVTTSTAACTTILSRCGNAGRRYGSIQVRCDLGKLSCPRDSLRMSQKPRAASKDEQIPPLLAAHSLRGARELRCPYTRLKVAPHVVGIQGQGVRAVQ